MSLKIPLRLQQLPKSDGSIKLNLRGTTPGSFSRFFTYPGTPVTGNVIDPSHPWAGQHPFSYRRNLPSFRSPQLSIQAYPKALLAKPAHLYPDPPFTCSRTGEKANVLDISMVMNVPKGIAKSSVIRHKLRKRVKFALELIVKRGATIEKSSEGPTSEERLVGGSPDAKVDRLVSQNWTYVICPTLELYRMPYRDLVQLIRRALPLINRNAQKLEKEWQKISEAQFQTPSAHEAGRSQVHKQGSARTIPKENLEVDVPEGMSPLEGIKRILSIVKEASEADIKEKAELQPVKNPPGDDSDIILDQAESYLERFKYLHEPTKERVADNVLFKQSSIIKLEEEEQDQLRRQRRRRSK